MAQSENEFPILNPDILEELESLQIPNEPDIVLELFETFVKTYPERIEKIQILIAEKNIKLLSKEAHALKSSARTLGAVRLAIACQILEEKAGELDQHEAFHSAILHETKSVIIEMKKIRSKLRI